MTPSIMQTKRECLICGAMTGLHRHHIFYGTANRQKSEEYGCWCWLCAFHHNGGPESVHGNDRMNRQLKQRTQRKFEETHTREEFMEIFGRSWL